MNFLTSSSLLEKVKFQQVSNPPTLLPVLERRLPYSCFIYNQLKAYESFKSDLKVYSLHPSDDKQDAEDVWFLINYYREDWGQTISISPPTPSPKEIPFRVQEALENTDVLDWRKRFVILAVDLPISDFIVKLNIRKFGHIIKIFPSYLFYMDPKEALKVELDYDDSQVELGPLNPLEGTQFLTENWDYTSEGSDIVIRKCIEKHVSAGVYIKNGETQGEQACGVITPGFGLVSSLVTHPDHRRKGYASLAMKYLCRQLAKNGFHPCWDAEIGNKNAIAFHTSINPRIIAKVDYISYKVL